MTDLYPIVIRQSRYGGVYEGGEWVAFAVYDELDQEALNDYFFGDDESAVILFFETPSLVYGYGDSPNEALNSLVKKYKDITTVGTL